MSSPMLLKQYMSGIASQCHDNLFHEALIDLHELYTNFQKKYFIYQSHDFKPELVEQLFLRMIPLLDYQDQKFKETLDLYLHQWFATCISFCPNNLINLIKAIHTKIQKPYVYPYLLDTLSNLILTLPLEKQLEQIAFLHKLIFDCPPQRLSRFDVRLWELLYNYLKEEDIIDIILFSMTSEDIRPASILIQKNPVNFVPILALSAPFDFLSKFLRGNRNFEFDALPLFAKIGDIITFEEIEDVTDVLKTFNVLLEKIDESNAGAVVAILKNLKKRFENKDPKIDENIKKHCLEALVKAEHRNLIKIDEIRPYFDINNTNYQKQILYSYLYHLEDEDENTSSKSLIYDLLFAITAKRAPKPLKMLVKTLAEKSDILQKIDTLKYDTIYGRVFNPLPKEEDIQIEILNLLNSKSDRQTLVSIVYNLIEGENHSQRYMIKLKDLVNNFNVEINISRLDWFSEKSHLNLLLFDHLEPSFILDLLSYNLVLPQHIDVALNSLCKLPEVSGPLAFNSIFGLLKKFVDVLGYTSTLSFEKMKLKLSVEEPNWIRPEDVYDMFTGIQNSVISSNYGQILSSILNALDVLKNYVTLTEPQVIAIIMICRFVSTSAPKATSKLLSSTWLDVTKENKVKLSEKNRVLLEKHVKFHFSEQLSLADSPTILNSLIQCLGEENVIKDYKTLVIDAVSKDAKLATKFQSLLDQPLPKMKTFLYFKDEKHKEWVTECRTSFLFNYWILNDNDFELIGEIPENVDPYYLDHHHTLLYNKVKGIEPKVAKVSTVELPEPTFYTHKKDVNVRQGPKMHLHEPSTMFGVISFLYHSLYNLPESVQNLEEYALANSDDIRMTIGYLSYAKDHNLNVDINKWINKIKVSPNCNMSIYAGSLLLNHVQILKPKATNEKENENKENENKENENETKENENENNENENENENNENENENENKENENENKENENENKENENENENENKEINEEDKLGNAKDPKEAKGLTEPIKSDEYEFIEGIDPEVEEFINESLDSLGYYDHTVDGIFRLYERETGMRWQFVRSVIRVSQRDYYKHSRLLILSEFCDINSTQEIIASSLQTLAEHQCHFSYSKFVQAMSTTFLFHSNEMKCAHLLPTNGEINQRLLTFVDATQMQKPLFIGQGVIDSIFSVLNQLEDTFPLSFVTILVNFASTDEQYTHICELFARRVGKCAEYSRVIMSHVQDYIDADSVMVELLNFKPPSYIRAFFRAIYKRRKAVISTNMKGAIDNLYKNIHAEHSVFPDLCYSGLGKISMTPWKSSQIQQHVATVLTRLRLGIIDLQTLMGAHTEIVPQNGEAPLFFVPISALEDNDLKESRAWPDAAEAKRDFVKVLLEAAVDECASTVFTNDVFNVLTCNSNVAEIAEIILNREFMNKGKFSAITLIFRKLESLLVSAEMEELVHKCMDFHNPIKNMFDDEQKINAFYNPNDEKSIYESLRYQRKENPA